ncbi:ectonucleoside triphosphate diphosphohydrolase 2 isoform X5 [Gallus gallus]|uniref:ectonucleoside triphosphate diphosphohydrolase 2 isoform X5 n=1 Tax=Gallus gallus TaxID=9031 RepID=UPI000739C08E|nr:ectonucleoside triphosphate diphosphohydrolase 2 isoform X5 [Gallus gallus]|eukprot:XP_015135164.1 ectonucleoside triphosphate diphosphohydrolase 2 isoform X5 [Gallus gallus]
MSWRELLPPWLVIVAGLTGIVLLCVSTKDVPIVPLRTKYGLVLDAGPSRTILFIYQWTTTKANKTRVIKECSSCTVQGPEISNYSHSPQKVGKSLDACLNWAQSKIPAEQHSQTPLYLGATTSTRQLNLSHPTRSDDLLAALTVALKSSPFDFQGVQILSSPDEEAFNWVAVNYVLENFFKEQSSAKTVPNPCWPLSYSQEVQWNSVHTGPCTVSDDTVDIPNPDHVFNITGTSNPTACMRLVQSLLNSSSSCSFFNNSPKRAAKPLQTRFLVMSEAMDFLKKTAPSPDLGQAVNKLCEMSVKELAKESQTSLDALADYCIVSAFIFHLSTKGYVFDFNQSVQAAFQIGDTSSMWTLGYLLNLTNTIPQDSPTFLKGIDSGVWSLLLILFVVLLTGSFMRISYRVMVKENSSSNRNSSVFDDN